MRKTFTLLGTLGLLLVCASHASAATPQTGLSVSPATENITLAAGQTSVSYNVVVTNKTSSPVVITVGARDFNSLDLTGSLSFFDSDPLAVSTAHSLAHSLSLGFTQVALGANQSQVVPVTILDADKLAPGGHYAAVSFKLASTDDKSGNRVIINQEVVSLVFVSSASGGTRTTDLETVLQDSFTTRLPTKLVIVLANNGNTQTIPRGMVEINGPKSRQVARGILNTESSLILPDSKRLFTIDLTTQKGRNWPGIYHLKIVYRHDGDTNFRTYQKTFLYINKPLFFALIISFLMLALWITWRFIPKTSYHPYRRK